MYFVYAGLAILFVAWVVTYRKLRALTSRLGDVLGGSDTKSIEQGLVSYHKKVRSVESRLDELNRLYGSVSSMASLASQKVSIIRFNPFGDTGGDQSFSLAVLDSHDSGYVLTSIHGRGGTRVYVKPIDFGKSKYQLSAEEQKAMSGAIKRVATQTIVKE